MSSEARGIKTSSESTIATTIFIILYWKVLDTRDSSGTLKATGVSATSSYCLSMAASESWNDEDPSEEEAICSDSKLFSVKVFSSVFSSFFGVTTFSLGLVSIFPNLNESRKEF